MNEEIYKRYKRKERIKLIIVIVLFLFLLLYFIFNVIPVSTDPYFRCQGICSDDYDSIDKQIACADSCSHVCQFVDDCPMKMREFIDENPDYDNQTIKAWAEEITGVEMILFG